MKTARIEYAAEAPPESGLTDWLNQKACDGWYLLAVDKGIYVFGRSGYFLWEEDPRGVLMSVPMGENG